MVWSLPKHAFFILLFAALIASNGKAQTANQRRAELAEVGNLIAGEPDPIMRLVNFEQIVADGDHLKTELAIRSALGVDDVTLRAAATRAYIRTARDVNFKWVLPEAIASKLTNSQKLTSLESNYHKIYLKKGGRIAVRFGDFREDGSFRVKAHGQILEEADGRTVGDKLVFRAKMRTSGIAFCNFEIRPTVDFELDGDVTCEDRLMGTPSRIVAPMF